VSGGDEWPWRCLSDRYLGVTDGFVEGWADFNPHVSFIQLWFTDVIGILKSFAITRRELAEALSEGMGFDGSSIEGFARIEESDMIAKPDPTTFQFLPWRPKDRPVARMFCDILNPDGTPYEGTPALPEADTQEGRRSRLPLLRRTGARVLLL